MEDNELVLSLDRDDEGPVVSFSKERPHFRGSVQSSPLHSSALHFPLSPSTPSSLGEISPSNPRTASIVSRSSTSGLVKSSSSSSSDTFESKNELASVKSKPLLSLVKSLSTEISRREPEVCLSKSDSKLHLPPWKQLGQSPKSQDVVDIVRDDSNTTESSSWTVASSSPCPLSPVGEHRGSLLMAEFEDTRRKLSEAMQEPLSMLSKIMGEEGGSPKTQKGGGVTLTTTTSGDSPASQGNSQGGGGIGGGPSSLWADDREGSPNVVCETPLRKPKKVPQSPQNLPPELRRRLGREGSRYEICTFGDIMQVVEVRECTDAEPKVTSRPPVPRVLSSGPGRWLVCVGLLAYGFFVLPLSSYLTGLSLGLACGFMMGLAVVLMLAPRRPASTRKPDTSPDNGLLTDSVGKGQREPGELQGWMNEMYSYDPETYHPSLCHSVYATLEGSRLQLAYPRANVPRHATYDESTHDATFVRWRTIRLTNSKVFLLPAVLAKKRVWNKKYPICIILAEDEELEEEEQQHYEPAGDGPERAEKEKEAGQNPILYLFGRTGREKEEWYQHFILASKSQHNTGPSRDELKTEVCGEGDQSSSDDNMSSMLALKELAGSVKDKLLLDYSSYMAHFVASDSCSLTPSPSHSGPPSPTHTHRSSSDPVTLSVEGRPAWINALIGRIFWDFLQEKYWADQVAHKIQKKLSKIRLPYFMNELTLAELDMGTCMPQVLSTSKPTVDQKGLWLQMEVLYAGSLQMTLETKMNLCKLGRDSSSESHCVTESSRSLSSRPRLCIIADSDEESSSAASSDEEDLMPSEPQSTLGDKSPPPVADGHGSGSTGRKILRFVDKIAKSKYFQKATENEYIKKKIAEVSNTPLMLTVEVLELSGTLTVNIPPPPTDRIWYSFRVPPRLDLRVRPMLGERELTFTHVTEWIERKLQCEFQKIFVMPNMDDLYLPLMSSGMDSPFPESQNSLGESQEQQESRGLD